MASLPVIISDDEEVIAPPRRSALKRRERFLFGADSEDESPSGPAKRSKIATTKKNKIKVHKVEIVRPPRSSAGSDPTPPCRTPSPAARPAPPTTAAARPAPPTTAAARPALASMSSEPAAPAIVGPVDVTFEDSDDDFTQMLTPSRAITPDIRQPEEADSEPYAQPLVDPVEMEFMCYEQALLEMPMFNVLCGTATVGTDFQMPPHVSVKDKNTRLIKNSFCAIDKYSRKFLSVGLTPNNGFAVSVCLSFDTATCFIGDFKRFVRYLRCVRSRLVNVLSPGDRRNRMVCENVVTTLAPGKRVRLAAWGANLDKLKSHEFINLSQDEIDSIIESEEFILSKLSVLRQWLDSSNVMKKYLYLLQSVSVKLVTANVKDTSIVKQYIRKEILASHGDDDVSDVFWELYIYYFNKMIHNLENVTKYMLKEDKLVV